MHLNLNSLLHLPVYTESGEKLGTVADAKLEVERHSLLGYSVRPHWFMSERYFIKPIQVKSITHERMVVDDNVVAARASGEFKIQRAPQAAPAGVATMAVDK